MLLCAQCIFAASDNKVQIRFRINQSAIDPGFKQNEKELSQADSLLSLDTTTGITIKASCSPDGPVTFNHYLARARAEEMVTYLKERHPDFPENRIKIEVTDEDWDALAAFVRRSGQAWKEEALSILNNKDNTNKKQLLQELWVGEAWDYMVKQYFPRLRTISIEFKTRAVTLPQTTNNQNDLSAVQILYPRGIRHIYPEYKNNREQLNKLDALAFSHTETLYIKTSSSPDGSSKANLELAENRAKAAEKYLKEQLGYKGQIVIQTTGEDWDGLARVIEASDKLAYKEEMLAIINDPSLDAISKKKQLNKIADGKAWKAVKSLDGYNSLRSTVISGK
jgi:outer membrane protein OmpA-like peptidoglycan-associated protein